jgi:hypothetical protein
LGLVDVVSPSSASAMRTLRLGIKDGARSTTSASDVGGRKDGRNSRGSMPLLRALAFRASSSREKLSGTGAVTVGVRLRASKLVPAEVVEVIPARDSVRWVVHTHVRGQVAAGWEFLEILAVAAFEDVNFRIVNLRIAMVIHHTVLGKEMLSAVPCISVHAPSIS